MLRERKEEGASPPSPFVVVKRQRYTKAERQRIRDQFAALHGGVFYPRLFIEAAEDPDHDAHDWFDWDDEHCGIQWRLEQARAFNRGLTKIKIITVHEESRVVRHKVSAPSMVSPLSGRRNGGGYSAPTQDELVRQAFRDFKGLSIRHKAALVARRVDGLMEQVLAALE
jgi:hypothetical protein